MNKIYQLLDDKYVHELFRREVLPRYPDFCAIKRIKTHKHKDKIWEKTYHVVFEYETTLAAEDGKRETVQIFCTAHSDEPRRNVYDGMRFLWDHGFGRSYSTIPRPLFYSEEFQGTFYRGVRGNHLYHYIREGNKRAIEALVPRAARWFAKLHNLPVKGARNFNKENSRIATVFPGRPHILKRVAERYPQHADIYRQAYERFTVEETAFFAATKKRWLVHGDAHPENVIKIGADKTAVIDFTDLCLAGCARGIGTFLQQLEFMMNRKLADPEYTAKTLALFRKGYFRTSKVRPSDELEARIGRYYLWTAMRTATQFLLQDGPEPERAEPLILMVKEKLEL